VGILRPIVQSLVRTVLNAGHDLPLCSVVGPKLISDYHSRRSALPLQELTHQTVGRLGITTTLHQNFQHKTILIDSTPEPVLLAADRNDGLVEVPLIIQPTG